MSDAVQWFIDLSIGDVGRIVAGLVVLITVIEFLASFRDWTK